MATPPADADSDLLPRIRRGDVGAFEDVFRRYHASLREFAEGYLRSSTAAEEIVQDVFLAIWARRGALRIHSTLRAYLFAAVRNRALNSSRHDALVRRTLFGLVRDVEHFGVPGMGAAAPAPDDALDAGDRRASLGAAIGRLPPRSRLAVTLRWAHQLSHAEVAETMGISVKGVEKLLSIALRHLRLDLGIDA